MTEDNLGLDEFMKKYNAKENIKLDLVWRIWRDGFSVSIPVFVLTMEDVFSILADEILEGKIDSSLEEWSWNELIDIIKEDIEYHLDWRPVIKYIVYEYISEVKGRIQDERRNEQQKREGTGVSEEEGDGSSFTQVVPSDSQ